MKCFVIPVIIGATWNCNQRTKNVWKQYQKVIRQILYRKTAVLGTLHILREVPQSETWSPSGSREV